ncbi:MAG: aminotransferase class IV [Bacillaceae bacterium]|nr:aminotransferase class IV [Bacillaceae bacterium]
MKVYVNGKLADENSAVISVNDHGFLYGAGLFETLRAYQGHLFLFDDHYQRLMKSAAVLGIKVDYSKQDLYEAVISTLKANQLTDAYIRITLSAGTYGVGLSSDPYHNPSWVIHTRPLPAFPADLYERGKKLVPLRTVSRHPAGTGSYKSLNFLPSVLGKKELGPQQELEGIFLTSDGYVAEGIVSNLFFVQNQTVFTPSLKTGILPGIARKLVIQLARRQGLQVEEGFYPLHLWKKADEVFLSNSVQELVPVREVDGVIIGTGRIGLITSGLLQDYRSHVTELMSVEALDISEEK